MLNSLNLNICCVLILWQTRTNELKHVYFFLPMVEMCEGSNSPSVNLRNMHVFPTPESPRSSSLNKTSYCLAMTLKTYYFPHDITFSWHCWRRAGSPLSRCCVQGASDTPPSKCKFQSSRVERCKNTNMLIFFNLNLMLVVFYSICSRLYHANLSLFVPL